MGVRSFIATGALLAVALGNVGTRAQQPPPAGQQSPPGEPAAGRGRQGGPNADRFAGQTPINAMIVTGGCCHGQSVAEHEGAGDRCEP